MKTHLNVKNRDAQMKDQKDGHSQGLCKLESLSEENSFSRNFNFNYYPHPTPRKTLAWPAPENLETITSNSTSSEKSLCSDQIPPTSPAPPHTSLDSQTFAPKPCSVPPIRTGPAGPFHQWEPGSAKLSGQVLRHGLPLDGAQDSKTKPRESRVTKETK